ncbi:hypothetical protein GCM10010353_65110 [Streptomyces chryseus]|nr:hypothetical protein GCM10010353_65110 [Streptomyces chryseus]
MRARLGNCEELAIRGGNHAVLVTLAGDLANAPRVGVAKPAEPHDGNEVAIPGEPGAERRGVSLRGPLGAGRHFPDGPGIGGLPQASVPAHPEEHASKPCGLVTPGMRRTLCVRLQVDADQHEVGICHKPWRVFHVRSPPSARSLSVSVQQDPDPLPALVSCCGCPQILFVSSAPGKGRDWYGSWTNHSTRETPGSAYVD